MSKLPARSESLEPDAAPAPDSASPAAAAPQASSNGDRPRRRRWLIASMMLAVGLPSAWGGYVWMFPAPAESSPSEVQVSRGPADGAPGEPFVPAVEVKGGHPIDPALEIARRGLDHIRKNVHDYTARLVKRERTDGKLGDEETIRLKVRNRKLEGEKRKVPLSVYMLFEKPAKAKGREVIWVEGANDGCLIAHEGSGLVKAYRAYLPPEHKWAMAGNRYPITHIGIENLIEKLIERGTREKMRGDCEVEFFDDVELKGGAEARACQMIELRHSERKPEFDFFKAQIFIDKEHFLPIRYAAYSWPEEEGGEPVLEEEYTYLDLKLNVGLADGDFDWKNPEYDFPSFTFP